MQYRFPPITISGDVLEVAKKCREEAQEVIDAIESGEAIERVAEELNDLCQAAETLHRRAVEQYGAEAMEAARLFVIEKCTKRGSYE